MATAAYAIFQGGGAKGLAHVAGIAAAEKNEIEFIGVAGASAGALIAALVAVGYSASELFDPNNPKANLLTRHGIDPLSLIGRPAWKKFASTTAPAPTGWFKRKINAPVRWWRWLRPARQVTTSGGYFTTDIVCERLDYFLRIKLMEHHANAGQTVNFTGPIRFKDIDPEVVEECCSLKVIVTDVTNGRPIIFGTSPEHGDIAVAEAVAASISIPGVFKPAKIPSYTAAPNALFADGGLVSNLPIWVFREEKLHYERTEHPKGTVPILAFSLAPAAGEPPTERPGSDAVRFKNRKEFFKYAMQVGNAAIFGGQTIVQGLIPDLLQIVIPVTLDTTEFDFTVERVLDCYYGAYAAAAGFLGQEFRIRPARINAVLAEFDQTIRAEIARCFPNTPIQHVRISLIKPFGQMSFRVVYTFNMHDDADDRLTFSRLVQGAPSAFDSRQPAFIDFGTTIAAGANANMTKYEFALLRRSLKSAICLPVFDQAQAWEEPQPTLRPQPLGVVSIDSDGDLSHIFQNQPLMRVFALMSLKFNEILRIEVGNE